MRLPGFGRAQRDMKTFLQGRPAVALSWPDDPLTEQAAAGPREGHREPAFCVKSRFPTPSAKTLYFSR